MQIQITAKQVYGNELLYPACDTSTIFCQLVRKKTLDIDDLLKIRKLGYEIKITGHVDPEVALALA
jgi:hypothetical protein